MQHTVDGVGFDVERGDVPSVGGEIEGWALIDAAGDENIARRRLRQPAHERVIGRHPPPLGTPKLFDQFDPAPPPRRRAREPQPARNDAIDFFPDDQLGERELCLFRERGNRLVSDAEQHAARDRLLVVLDLLLEIPLVFVSERPGRTTCPEERRRRRVFHRGCRRDALS